MMGHRHLNEKEGCCMYAGGTDELLLCRLLLGKLLLGKLLLGKLLLR